MNKIEFKISKNFIIVDLVNKDIKENLNNTNVINTKEIYFSDKYIGMNIELVSSFLHVITLKNNIDSVRIKNKNCTLVVLSLINCLSRISNLYIDYDESLCYGEFLELLNNKYLKYINLYDIPPYLLERLDINNNLEIDMRNEVLFISNFMISNKINNYSDMFYKKEIVIEEFNDRDYYDFDSFIQVNKYLRCIVFKFFDKKLFNYVVKGIKDNNLNNIRIVFKEDSVNLSDVAYYVSRFKKVNEDFIFSNGIDFKIDYSKEYKEKNIFRQLNLNIIKYSLVFVIIVICLMVSVNLYRNFVDSNKYDTIENDLNKLLEDVSSSDTPVNNDDDLIFIKPNEDDIDKLTETTTTTGIYDIKYEKVFEKLLDINKDTVGWLTVNNTNIDYPVVQYTDNDYYLNRDYYQNKNRHGWVFMDYRNNYSDLSDNTIIYGHNLANQKMFGTLRYALNSSWYMKTNNQVITLNTLDNNLKWKIISIYKLPKTNDYLIANFSSPDEKLKFLKMITERSIYDFNEDYDEDTKILTLSTCSNGTKERLVVHAKLIK